MLQTGSNSVAYILRGVQWQTSSRAAGLFYVWVSKELTWRLSPSWQAHPQLDYNYYRTHNNANTKTVDDKLLWRNDHREFHMFRYIPCIMYVLPKPQKPHSMQIGTPDHLQRWNFHFMKSPERQYNYNAIWLAVPADHNLTPMKKLCKEVSEWNGNEKQEMSRFMLGVVTLTLRGRRLPHYLIFNHAFNCIWTLFEFYRNARYTYHNEAILSYVEDVLRHLQTCNDDFWLLRASKNRSAKVNLLRMRLVKMWNIDEEINAETWMPAKKWPEINACGVYISHEIDFSKEWDTEFNFLEIYLISHWVEHIRWDGALQQHSAESHNEVYKMNLKMGWNTSNHIPNNAL